MATSQQSIGSDDELSVRDEDGVDASAEQPKDKDSFFATLRKVIGKDIDSLRLSVPLFLLEPLSNLEYLAELEHPEFFVLAPLIDDPMQRFLSIVNVLASTFKKAALGKKVKKPINPVLGEVFACVFTEQIPSSNNASSTHSSASDIRQASDLLEEEVSLDASGPMAIPDTSSITLPARKSDEDDTSTTAELARDPSSSQIPKVFLIAAFYAACPERAISTTLLYDLRAKFTGMSFQLINHSFAIVSIDNRDEQYRITYPNAAVAGVFTLNFKLVWSGSCSVICEKTGLRAVILFKEKKWFGKETYEVTGSVHDLGDEKKIYYTIGGNWDGDITLTDINTQETQTLFSAFSKSAYKSTPLYGYKTPTSTEVISSSPPQQVQPISSPIIIEMMESINPSIPYAQTSQAVWGNVIAAMLRGDKDTSNRLKGEIEERQRKFDKEAKLQGKTHSPLYFKWVESNNHGSVSVSTRSLNSSQNDVCPENSAGDKKKDKKKESKKDGESPQAREYYPLDKGRWVFTGSIATMIDRETSKSESCQDTRQ